MHWTVRAAGIRRVAICAVAALLPACYQGTHPLAPGGTDARLDGEWRCIGDDSDGAVMLSIHAPDTRHHDVSLRAPDEDADRYLAHVARFADTDIASVQELSDGKPTGKWVYVRYRFLREGVLDLGLVAEEKLEHAKDPQAALDEIRARAGDERIYDDLLVCVRAKPSR